MEYKVQILYWEKVKNVCRHEKFLTYWSNPTPSKKDSALISFILHSSFHLSPPVSPVWWSKKSKSDVNSVKYLLWQMTRDCQEDRVFVDDCTHTKGWFKNWKANSTSAKKEKSVFLIMVENKTRTVYRIQEIFLSLWVFSLRLHRPFGKMIFRLDTHHWPWGNPVCGKWDWVGTRGGPTQLYQQMSLGLSTQCLH